MATSPSPKTTLSKTLNTTLNIILYRDKGVPIGFQVQTQKLVVWLSIAFLVLTGLSAGTLLLFRELEKNRLLTQELHSTQSQCTTTASACTVSQPTIPPPPPSPTVNPLVQAPESPRVIQSVTPTLIPTISELSATCTADACQAHFTMTAQGSGAATGRLLLVLETEVPRIGGSTATNDALTRKKYFFYPEQPSQDQLVTEALNGLKQNPFRFNRTLRTTASFTLGSFLRPLSINAYVFDENQTLLRHERKPIEENP